MTTTLKEIATEVNAIEDRLAINLDAVMHKLTQELGEFNDAIQKYRGIYCKTRKTKEDIQEEAGDLFTNFISILNRVGVDPDVLPELAKNSLRKFHEREMLYKQHQED
ncbi:MAG: hypothetical protein CR971_00320 [candidate division SR1 bacterium]|nr:MAG: hypothetical protein CR971_00320 [candidate division SR1 bacterium]